MSVTRRLARKVGRKGSLRIVAEYARKRWNRAFDRRVVAWEWRPDAALRGAAASATGRDGLRVERYGRPEEVPAVFFAAVAEAEGPEALERFRGEFADAGVLWVPWLAGEPAGYQWTRRGDLVDPWHFPLGPETTLVFSVVTFRPVRGRKVAVRTTAHICDAEVTPGGRAVGESFAWNTASVRTFEAAGFRRLSTHRPYPGYPD